MPPSFTIDPPATTVARSLIRLEPQSLYLQGLVLCGLLEELDARGPVTLFSPTNAAFAGLPWPVANLFGDDELNDALFDLFEYTVVPGLHEAAGPRRSLDTVRGSRLVLDRGTLFGEWGAGRVLRTVKAGQVLIHLTDGCILPTRPFRTLPSAWSGLSLVA